MIIWTKHLIGRKRVTLKPRECVGKEGGTRPAVNATGPLRLREISKEFRGLPALPVR